MKLGISRFEYYLDKLQALLEKAGKQKNPALWLYRNNARTHLFQLEGLAKLYGCLHNEKKFSKLKDQFKLLEDGIGGIDYYDCLAKEFAANQQTKPISKYLQAQAREKTQALNEILVEKKWVGARNKRINKIRETLGEANWLKAPEEIEAIHQFYINSINKIDGFINQRNFHFENVEDDVHELRRMLRWLSIYPQGLRGCIQLSQLQPVPEYLPKYLTPEITSSAFNVLPEAGPNRHFLLLEKNHFYALSWMIAELGKLKDCGLRVVAAKEALQQSAPITDDKAYEQVYELLGKDQPTIQHILDKAEIICKTYTDEKNLDHLLIGTAAVH